MNGKQKFVLWLGIIAFVLMGLFPPWTYPIKVYTATSRLSAGYSLLFTPPTGKGEGGKILEASIDFHRLAVQWAIVTVITGGLIATVKPMRPEKT